MPEGVVLHHADIPDDERTWFGAVPATKAARTLNDCARTGLSPELLRAATRQALRRQPVTKSELSDVNKALKPFGGIG